LRYGPCIATVTCTYSSALSKNARLKRSFRGRLYIAPAAKAAEKVLESELTTGLKGVKMYQNRIYLDIQVNKSRNTVDALNFVDAVADCLKRVIGVDDKWYGIKALDWTLNKTNPSIIIKLYQPERKDAKK
jgi:hypothetical protein